MQFIDLKTQSKRIESSLFERFKGIMNEASYIMGPDVSTLENALASYVGVRHAITVASGTDALLIALMALGIGPQDEVITTPFSFFATVEVILLLGAKPVFVDIDPLTYHLDVAELEHAITERTKAIMPVSLYGQCANMRVINQLALEYNLPVIEDAAQSFGATHHGELSCGLSTIGCTSFFPSKPLGAYGDGGACFTDDDVLAERMVEIRLHGQSERYLHTRLGINGRLDTFQAAVLLEKLAIFPEEVERRQVIADRYRAWLPSSVQTPMILPENQSVYAQYTVEVSHRDKVQRGLQALGIPTAIHYPLGLHEQPILKQLGVSTATFPVTERAARRVLSLPMHPYLTTSDQRQIVDGLMNVLSETEAFSV